MYDLVICSKMTIGIELLINYNHSCDTKSCVISDAILNGFECNCRKNHNCTKMFVMISISVKESTLFFLVINGCVGKVAVAVLCCS